MQPDDLNLSDAILTALRDAGWIGALVRNGAHATTLPHKRTRHLSVAIAAGLRVPPGVTWDAYSGRFISRLWMNKREDLRLGHCAPCQEELDRLGALWARARALRDAGVSRDAIREELGL